MAASDYAAMYMLAQAPGGGRRRSERATNNIENLAKTGGRIPERRIVDSCSVVCDVVVYPRHMARVAIQRHLHHAQ
jgi:hypothetical protein